MTAWAAPAVYLLCLATSTVCAGLLLRAWFRTRARLLLWTAIAFVLLALNNVFLVADRVFFPDYYLLPFRQITALAAIAVLIYGFIWEAES
ncbi:DUF5985 family protein [Phenylobacterium deserti]|uniref:Uncharacterized protein n=1 Tax=Phenylobacterium deserti TaxID=1914756 RepID=A0A328APK9_9CAUL|nr:DUF5985 family protein [Phenylobacterium deserti]RAK56943.1 hypothetical protein DJ018_02955 [Phenylobacterium deserti]